MLAPSARRTLAHSRVTTLHSSSRSVRAAKARPSWCNSRRRALSSNIAPTLPYLQGQFFHRSTAGPRLLYVGAHGTVMGEGFRRLWLGVLLIAGVSLGLLLFDRGGRRDGTAAHRKRVSMLAFISAADSDECQRGMRDGLAAELREGVDYELIVRNAQGDMPTLTSLVDAALGDQSDLILTLSTPTLQAAVQRVKSTPIVFSFSSNPLGAGAGTTYERHLPNVTGIPTTGAYEEVVQLIRQLLPGARRLGTLVV